ncbi:MAG: 23S rRNA (uracil(1939)-C(5))-methyltransferase RlmD, partial [Flavobacteriaceae bacterium]
MGVAKNDEGVVYFIKDVIPGDVVDVQVYKKGRRYFEAKPIQWITKSPYSKTPPCGYFGVCGGCKLQHLSYQGQLEYKEKGVLHNLNNIGKIDIGTVLPIAGVENPYYYRNKMEFSFSNKRWLTTEEIAQ